MFSLPKQLTQLHDLFQINIKKSNLNSVPLLLNDDDILQGHISFADIPFVNLMPILLLDLNARKRYAIKQELDRVTLKEIERLGQQHTPAHFLVSSSEKLRLILNVDIQEYQQKLDQVLPKVLKNKRCQQLRCLYHMNLYSVQEIDPKCRGREVVQFQYSKEEVRIVTQTLEAAVLGGSYHALFRKIIQINQLTNSALNDEICLFTTRWIYAKTVLCSLRECIRDYARATLSQALVSEPLDEQRQEKRNESSKNADLLRFSNLERILEMRKYKHVASNTSSDETGVRLDMLSNFDCVFQVVLNEIAYLSIEFVRDLLIAFALTLNETQAALDPSNKKMTNNESDSSLASSQTQSLSRSKSQEDTFKTHVEEERSSCIHLPLHSQDEPESVLSGKLRYKLQALFNQLYQRKLLKKKLQSEQSEPDADSFMPELWKCIVESMHQLNSEHFLYTAEIRLASKRQLHNSSAFISRKFLYFLVRNLFQSLFIIVTDLYGKLPNNWANEVQLCKLKLDILMDYAFVQHLKNDVLAVLANINSSFQIHRPQLIRFLHEDISSINVHKVLSEMISLIKFKLLKGQLVSSPLYQAFLVENTKLKYLVEEHSSGNLNIDSVLQKFDIRALSSSNESIAYIKDPAKPITDIIENEILMRYLHLAPKLECLQEVAESGTELAHDLGMNKLYYQT